MNAVMYASAEDNAASIEVVAYNLSNRTPTSTQVTWYNSSIPNDAWAISPECKNIVQEIVNRSINSMEGLINLFNTLHDVEPVVTLLLGISSFSVGFIGGMLKQKYTEGKIKGEIDTKFANAGRKIESIDSYIDRKINPRLDALEDAMNAYSQSLSACQRLQQERFNTKTAELISAVKTMIADEFRDLELRMDALRDRARKEKREELEELKTYVDDKFSALVYEKANSL